MNTQPIDDQEQQIRQAGRNDVHRVGQHIAVFDRPRDDRLLIGYGKIIKREWYEQFGFWWYTIQVCQSRAVIEAWHFNTQPTTPSELRMMFTSAWSRQ